MYKKMAFGEGRGLSSLSEIVESFHLEVAFSSAFVDA